MSRESGLALCSYLFLWVRMALMHERCVGGLMHHLFGLNKEICVFNYQAKAFGYCARVARVARMLSIYG